MNPKEKSSSGIGGLIFTILALLFTGITAWLLSMMLSGSQYTKEPVKPVVVAKTTIEPLQTITANELKVVQMPESAIPTDSFTKIDDVLAAKTTMPAVRIYEGEAILKQKLADTNSGPGLSTKIPDNMRAMVIRLEDAAVQARLFYPEAQVDVVATVRLVKQSTVVTRVIVQNLQVLAVGTTVDPSHMAEPSGAGTLAGKTEEKDSVVTLLVRPDQAEMLMLAQREGRLDLVLRRQKDKSEAQTGSGVQPEDLFPGLVTSEPGVNKDAERRAAEQRILSQPRFKRPEGETIQVQ